MPPQPPANQSDNSMAALWIMVGTLVAVAVLWINFKPQLVNAFFAIKLAEIAFVSLFSDSLLATKAWIVQADPAHVTFEQILKNAALPVGDWLRYPFVVILGLLAVALYFGSTAQSFKHTYTMRTLRNAEKNNWPQIMPVEKLDLVQMDIDKGTWAMAMTPMQFCKANNLLQEHARKAVEGKLRKEAVGTDVTVKRGLATKKFIMQLGPLWKGSPQLNPHTRALFAVFAARLNGDGKAAAALLTQISKSSETKLDFSGVDELCAKYENTKLVQKIISNHAYVLSVMATMILQAREDGVLASADFLWLKPVDRKLWYMLNAVGRQTPWTEVAGPFAHWIAEIEIGGRLVHPMVEEATYALELAIKEVIYQPDTTN